jgi:hypothetical protein
LLCPDPGEPVFERDGKRADWYHVIGWAGSFNSRSFCGNPGRQGPVKGQFQCACERVIFGEDKVSGTLWFGNITVKCADVQMCKCAHDIFSSKSHSSMQIKNLEISNISMEEWKYESIFLTKHISLTVG